MPSQYRIKSAFQSQYDEYDGSGKRPVVFDIIGPDRETSLLPPDLKMVLHVNPSSMQTTYAKNISRQQTMAGFVEYHWGSNPTEITFSMSTGGFMRLYTGLSNITGPTPSNNLIQPASMQATSVGGTRRETIAYDKYLDLLALFKNNGSIYDSNGNIALQGMIRITYDGGSWWGWFSTFSVEESAEKPYQFALNAAFVVEKEMHLTKSVYQPNNVTNNAATTSPLKPGTTAPATPPTPVAPRAWTPPAPPAPPQTSTVAAPIPAPVHRAQPARRTAGTTRPSTGTTTTRTTPAVAPSPAASPSPQQPAPSTPRFDPASVRIDFNRG